MVPALRTPNATSTMRKILIVALFAALCSPARGADTPMFRGDLDHTGVYDSPPVAQTAHVKWAFHTRGYVNSSPVVANSVVYVGSADDNMYALDETTGKSLWHFKTGTRDIVGELTASVRKEGMRMGLYYSGGYDWTFVPGPIREAADYQKVKPQSE